MLTRIAEKTNRFQIVPLEERIAPSLLSICISIGFGKDDGCKTDRDPCHEPPKDPCHPKRW